MASNRLNLLFPQGVFHFYFFVIRSTHFTGMLRSCQIPFRSAIINCILVSVGML